MAFSLIPRHSLCEVEISSWYKPVTQNKADMETQISSNTHGWKHDRMRKASWIYRLTNNSTFFVSDLQSGCGGQTSSFVGPSQEF